MVAFRAHLLAERNSSALTAENYFRDVSQFATFRWGASAEAPLQWARVSPEDARNFLMKFAGDGARPATTRRKLASLRTFFRFLVREGSLESNPFAGLRGPKLGKSLPKVLSVEEMKRFLATPLEEMAARKKAGGISDAEEYGFLRDAAIFEALYSTGCRISEVTPLKWGEINFDSGSVIVRGKGAKERLCILGGPAVAALRTLRKKWKSLQ